MRCKYLPLTEWNYLRSGPYKIFIADSPCKIIQGLQGIRALPKDTFMLFRNISAGTFFHTRNCLFDLDIVALNHMGRILNIYTVKPGSDNIGPMPLNTTKVIEAPAFWFQKNGIKPGSYVPLLNV